MCYFNMKRIIGLIVTLALAGVVTFGGSGNFPSNHDGNRPSLEEEESARINSNLLHDLLMAALFEQFAEAVSLDAEQDNPPIFNNSNRSLFGIFSRSSGWARSR